MVNNVVLIGRITRDPEIRSSATGTNFCNFTLAVNRNFKNQSGEYDADFVGCVAFNQTATLIEQYVKKGHLLCVTGRIQTRNYEDNTGRRVYVTEVVAERVNFLESRKTAQSAVPSDMGSDTPTAPTFESSDVDVSIDDDDLPF